MISSERMAAVDENAEFLGVPRKQLMESSGNAVARAVRRVADPDSSVAIVAGRGNNGGDAFVAARFLDEYDPTVHLLGRPETISTDIARENWDALVAAEYDVRTVTDSKSLDLGDPDVVVDAMLGTGVTGELREPEATAAEATDALDATVVSVDVPSGLDADTGERADAAVSADHVVTFHDEKPGLSELDAEVTVADIGIPAAAELFVGPGDLRTVRRGVRGGDSRVFVVGGGPYTGAPALAGQAALRAGASLSFVAAPEKVAGQIQGYAEDLIVQDYPGDHLTPDQVDGLVGTAHDYDDVVVLGPGLGDDDETLEAARRFLESFEGEAVVDADALPVVPEVDTDATLVCTPNRKELAKMGGPDVEGPLRDARDDIEAFAADVGHVVVAKAAEDVVTDGERTRIVRAGTPAMAVGGTGDTLAGVIAGLLGTQDPFDAACAGPFVNGRAAERLDAERGDGLLASDLLDAIPRALWGDES
ncbi:NAD(P)H-hydrate dehydratase [Halopelagius longus]|uniref:Bifunctional NAD(P)H-hydrate repair enzyme n=1 Tax=Halopelagius longus TaxID=1236180 RepID=A0A1H1B395_9EURY|nr:NAD(P)H-hydrate dehydratase [Halopelagius longus]RDI70608.1 NAD(P)H-hydrate dehydratase [Halopelagius longus]SDQ45896.1 NAD(P)H-hydrate epimerase [Halopelagius longus]